MSRAGHKKAKKLLARKAIKCINRKELEERRKARGNKK
jgi:hypothetical protein